MLFKLLNVYVHINKATFSSMHQAKKCASDCIIAWAKSLPSQCAYKPGSVCLLIMVWKEACNHSVCRKGAYGIHQCKNLSWKFWKHGILSHVEPGFFFRSFNNTFSLYKKFPPEINNWTYYVNLPVTPLWQIWTLLINVLVCFFPSHSEQKENPLWTEFAVVVMDKKVLQLFHSSILEKNEVNFTNPGKNSVHEP